MRVTQSVKQETRERILQSAKELFARQGYAKTTTREIAEEAEIATGTLFNYYPTKAVLLSALVEECQDAAISDHVARKFGGIEEQLYDLVSSLIKHLAEFRGHASGVFQDSMQGGPGAESSLRLKHCAQVARAMARYGFSEEAGFMSLHLWWALLCGVIAYWESDQSKGQEDTRAAIDSCVSLFCGALGNIHH